MKYRTLLALLLLAVGLAACDDTSITSGKPDERINTAAQIIDTPIGHVGEVRLNDGTRCVILNRGGITCDWKQEGCAK